MTGHVGLLPDAAGFLVESHGWSIPATESDDGGARFEISGVAFDAW